MSNEVNELSEDMEVVGPGLMLSDARQKLSLSVDDIAQKLKFRNCLVKDIEQDIFDQKLPATYNRGYLRSYARLVNIDEAEVLSAFDMLGVAEVQRSEMQSFSNLTEKQAEHSRLMWFSYLIVAILFGLMVLWWLQEPTQVIDEKPQVEQKVTAQIENNQPEDINSGSINSDSIKSTEISATPLIKIELTEQEIAKPVLNEPSGSIPEVIVIEKVNSSESLAVNQESIVELSTAVFTFSGDCWVNIHDATGERIAWGVKRSGYVMSIEGKAPLTITLGKPELASIVFNGQSVDMSSFNVGNIAKFTLPLNL